MMRSFFGMYCDNAFKNVVFPDPVPPLMNILYPAATNEARNPDTSELIDCHSISLFIVITSFANFRIVTIGPFSATGGSTTFTRDPSASLASTIGDASFTSLLDPATIC